MGRNSTTEEVAEQVPHGAFENPAPTWRWQGVEPGTLGRKVGRHVLFDEDALDRWDREQSAAQQSA